MQPLDVQQIGNDLAIKWADGSESFIPLERMRRHCPCAGCSGETDIMGNVHGGKISAYGPRSFVLTKLERTGGYGIRPQWGDGHVTGIYSFDYLKRLATEA